MKKILIILGVLILTGCSKSTEQMAKNISKKIIEAHHTENVNLKGLNKEEKELFNNYINNEKKENKVINITKNVLFDPDSYSESNTYGIYSKDDDYYISYSDIVWQETLDRDDYYAVISLNGMQNGLMKSQVPILYDETHDNPKYNYEFLKSKRDKDTIIYYYKSKYDNSGFTIEYHLDGTKINDITSYYTSKYYSVNE